MSRAFLVVLDSVGCGHAPDAAEFGDAGANTLGHIHERVGLRMPNLRRLGLGRAAGIGTDATPAGLYGVAREVSRGKDTPSGHWELAGVPVPWDWHYFPQTHPSFPHDITAAVARFCGTDGILGDCHASGTDIINRLGAEHLRTGKPICYTSADSVFQIAAHEDSFGLDRLLALCEHLAPMLHEMKVGRVIARPFVGEAGAFRRTANRHDYAVDVPAPTLLDWAKADGRATYGVGKIGEIFSGRAVDYSRKGFDDALMGHLSELVDEAPDGALIFANFVEFDSLYGHRRDPAGYAAHLEWFDASIGPVLARLAPGDLMLFTADHGNDPTWHGTEHTREQVPVLAAGAGTKDIGQVMFVDVAASVAAHLGLSEHGPGRSFL